MLSYTSVFCHVLVWLGALNVNAFQYFKCSTCVCLETHQIANAVQPLLMLQASQNDTTYVFENIGGDECCLPIVRHTDENSVHNISIIYRNVTFINGNCATLFRSTLVEVTARTSLSSVSVIFDRVTFIQRKRRNSTAFSHIFRFHADHSAANVSIRLTNCHFELAMSGELLIVSSPLLTNIAVILQSTVVVIRSAGDYANQGGSVGAVGYVLHVKSVLNNMQESNMENIHVRFTSCTVQFDACSEMLSNSAALCSGETEGKASAVELLGNTATETDIVLENTTLSATVHRSNDVQQFVPRVKLNVIFFEVTDIQHLSVVFAFVDVVLNASTRAAMIDSYGGVHSGWHNAFHFSNTYVKVAATGAIVTAVTRYARLLTWRPSNVSINTTVVLVNVSLNAVVHSSALESAIVSGVFISDMFFGGSLDFQNVSVFADIRNGSFRSKTPLFPVSSGTLSASILETGTQGMLRNMSVEFADCQVSVRYGARLEDFFGGPVTIGGVITSTAVFFNCMSFIHVAVVARRCGVRVLSSSFGSSVPDDIGFFCNSTVYGANMTGIVLFQSGVFMLDLYRGCCGFNSLLCSLTGLTELFNRSSTPAVCSEAFVTIEDCWIDSSFTINQREWDVTALVWLHEQTNNTSVLIRREVSQTITSSTVVAVACAGCNASHTTIRVKSTLPFYLKALLVFYGLHSTIANVTTIVQDSTLRSPTSLQLISAAGARLRICLQSSSVSLINVSLFAPAMAITGPNVLLSRSSAVFYNCSMWNGSPMSSTSNVAVGPTEDDGRVCRNDHKIEAFCPLWKQQDYIPSIGENELAAVGAVSAIASFVSSSGTSIRRLTLAPSCGGLASALESPVDATNDPLRLRFGPTAGAAHRGAVVGNTVFVLAAALCALVAVRVLHRVKRGAVCMRGCAALLQLPGALMIVVGLLYQQVMASSVLLLWSAAQSEVDGVGAADAVVGACGCALCAGVLAALVRVLLLRFEARGLPAAAVPYAARWQAVLAYCVADRVQWQPRRGGDGKRQSADSGARWFVGCYGRLFRGCWTRREWWLAGDVCVTMVLSAVSGLVPTTAGGCRVEEWVFVVVTGAWLIATVVLRPKHRRLVLVKDVVSNGGQFVLAMCRALLADKNSVILQHILLVITAVCFGLSVLVFGSNLILSRRHVSSSRDDAPWGRAADILENSIDGKALGLLIMAVCDAQRRTHRSK